MASYLAPPPHDYLFALIHAVEAAKSPEHRFDALQILWNLSHRIEYRHAFCESSLDFFPTILSILDTDPQIANLLMATKILWYLSREPSIRLKICCEQTNLLPSLLRLLEQYGRANATLKEHILKYLSNSSLEFRTIPYLLSEESRYLSYLREELIAQNHLSYQSIFNLVAALRNDQLHYLLKYDIPAIIYHIFTTLSTNPFHWNPRFNGVPYWALNALLAISSLPDGAAVLRELDQRSLYFPRLASHRIVESIKALFIVANLYGADDDQYKTLHHLFQTHDYLMTTTLNCLKAVMDFQPDHGYVRLLMARGYAFSIIKLRDISSALRNMAIAACNKPLLLRETEILRLVVVAIRDFVMDAPQYSATGQLAPIVYGGGGGSDYDSLEHLLELLLLLSHEYDLQSLKNCQKLKQQLFLDQPHRLIEVLSELLALPQSRLGAEAKARGIANLLIQKYQECETNLEKFHSLPGEFQLLHLTDEFDPKDK